MADDSNSAMTTIARIAGREIAYGEIAIDREWAERHPRWLRGLSVEEACLEEEQRLFAGIVANALIELACEREHCVLDDASIAPYRSKILADEASLHGMAKEARRVPVAVRRVYRGEDIAVVYDEEIRSMNRSLDEFREEVARYRSLDVVERFLAKDWVASTREHFERGARQRAIRAFIRAHIEALAGDRDVEAVADEYFRNLTTIELCDQRFRIPTGGGILHLVER